MAVTVGLVVGVAVMMPVAMRVAMPVIMTVGVPIGMPVAVAMLLPFDGGSAASANRAHQMTSISLICNSSPPWGRSFPPPQWGQGSSRFSIPTSVMQS